MKEGKLKDLEMVNIITEETNNYTELNEKGVKMRSTNLILQHYINECSR